MKTLALVAATLTFAASSLLAQGLGPDIAAARQKNAALMKQFSWNSRIEILDNGTVKDTRIDQVTYGPSGQLQHTTLNDISSPMPSGFLRKRIAEKEKEKMEKYLAGLTKFLDQYTLPTSIAMSTFFATATISPPDANGIITLTGANAVVPGDTVTLSVKAETRLPVRIQISSTYEGDPVTVTATFKTLANGLNYMAYGQVAIPAKNLSLMVQNYDFINQNL